MHPNELEKWADQINFANICDGGKFHVMLVPGEFWEYVEQGGAKKEPVVVQNRGSRIELSLMPIYDPQVIDFFHISPKHCSVLCQHDFSKFQKAYALQGGTLDY
jgi:hypothetical protein